MPLPFLFDFLFRSGLCVGTVGIAAGPAFAGVALVQDVFNKFIDTVKTSDKENYSLKKISKELNIPEYTLRRYITLNKLKAYCENGSDNPRKIGYRVTKESLLDFLTNNKDVLIKTMDKVLKKNKEQNTEFSDQISKNNCGENNSFTQYNDLKENIKNITSLEECDLIKDSLNREICAIKLDIDEINLTDIKDQTPEQKKTKIQKQRDILQIEALITMCELRKLELAKEN